MKYCNPDVKMLTDQMKMLHFAFYELVMSTNFSKSYLIIKAME